MHRPSTLTALLCLFCLLAACGPMTLPEGTPRATGTPTPWNFLNWPQEPWPPLTPYNTIKLGVSMIARLTGTVVGPDEVLINAQMWVLGDTPQGYITLTLPSALTVVDGTPLALANSFHEGDYITHTLRAKVGVLTDVLTLMLIGQSWGMNPTTGQFDYFKGGGSCPLYLRHGPNGALEISWDKYFGTPPTPCFGCGVMTLTDTPGPAPTIDPLDLTFESFRLTQMPPRSTP